MQSPFTLLRVWQLSSMATAAMLVTGCVDGLQTERSGGASRVSGLAPRESGEAEREPSEGDPADADDADGSGSARPSNGDEAGASDAEALAPGADAGSDDRADTSADTDTDARTDDTAEEDTEASTGEYRGYFCPDALFIITEGITRADALANCELNAAANPGRGVRCEWNGEEIFAVEYEAGECGDGATLVQEATPTGAADEEEDAIDGCWRSCVDAAFPQLIACRESGGDDDVCMASFYASVYACGAACSGESQGADAAAPEAATGASDATDDAGEDTRDDAADATIEDPSRDAPRAVSALCGLFRGGLSTAEHMIASPNPPESIEDSDEACIAYCDASGWQAGDVCVRDGVVIHAY